MVIYTDMINIELFLHSHSDKRFKTCNGVGCSFMICLCIDADVITFEARYEKCMRNQSKHVSCMDERMETAQVSIAM